jgi:hypothetical protein
MTNEEKQESQRAQHEITRVWLDVLLRYISFDMSETPIRELTFWKMLVEVETGGLYLLSFTHVKGPKIPMKEDQP